MARICSIDGCAAVHYGKGLCAKHYARRRRHGDPNARMKAANGDKIAWANSALLAETDECLIFPFPAGAHGYGTVTHKGAHVLVHRFICERAHGDPPSPHHHAAHSCGHRRCGNKRHIRWATKAENEADKLIHGTLTRGERHGSSKLSAAQVLAIRAADGSQRKTAARFGITQQTVSDIKTGRRWAWL